MASLANMRTGRLEIEIEKWKISYGWPHWPMRTGRLEITAALIKTILIAAPEIGVEDVF